MLAETIDAGLLLAAVERKNDERSIITKFSTAIMQNISPERQRINQSERSASVYEKSYDVFCKEVIETEIIGDKKIIYMKDILEKFQS